MEIQSFEEQKLDSTFCFEFISKGLKEEDHKKVKEFLMKWYIFF